MKQITFEHSKTSKTNIMNERINFIHGIGFCCLGMIKSNFHDLGETTKELKSKFPFYYNNQNVEQFIYLH